MVRGGDSRALFAPCDRMSISGFFKDLADTFDPIRMGDMGCVAVRKVPPNGSQAGRASPARRPGPEPHPEVREAERQSRALITLIQTAIERRERALRDLGEETSVQSSTAAIGDCNLIGRLAIQPFTDQVLAREDIEPADLVDARVDVTELLSISPPSLPKGAIDAHRNDPDNTFVMPGEVRREWVDRQPKPLPPMPGSQHGIGSPSDELAVELSRELSHLQSCRMDALKQRSRSGADLGSSSADIGAVPSAAGEAPGGIAYTVVSTPPTEGLLQAKRNHGRTSRREGDDSDTASFHDDDDDSQ